jgi:hypothetical protein
MKIIGTHKHKETVLMHFSFTTCLSVYVIPETTEQNIFKIDLVFKTYTKTLSV